MIEPEPVACPRCHEPAPDGDTYCEACGGRLWPEVATTLDQHDDDRAETTADGVAGVSDRGRLRKRNEDAVRVGSAAGGTFAIVCDGVASSVGGRMAADAAVETVGNSFRDALESRGSAGDWDPESTMESAMAAAQAAVLRVPARSNAPDEAPSCTFVAALWDGQRVTVGNVGDSRAYWVGATQTLRLTVDDSWAQLQIDARLMSEAEAMDASDAHVITRWLGRDAPDEPYEVTTLQPRESGRVLLCSDGMWQYASATTEMQELVQLLSSSITPIELACRSRQRRMRTRRNRQRHRRDHRR